MADDYSIAIETSHRCGGVALGRGDELLREIAFDASSRHAAQLVHRLDELLEAEGIRPADLGEAYVSAGPGSFTGVRVGVTVARTLAQAVDGLRCVRVPSPLATAEGAAELDWQRLIVVLDARDEFVHASRFVREGETIKPEGEPGVVAETQLLAGVPRPVTLVGEGLHYHTFAGEGVTVPPLESSVHLPDAGAVWRVGRRLALAGEYTSRAELRPIYTREPEAVRLWRQRGG